MRKLACTQATLKPGDVALIGAEPIGELLLREAAASVP
jgi:hypothetical protein